MRRFLPPAAAFALLFLGGCVKDVTAEQRLDEATHGLDPGDPLDEKKLEKLSCSDAGPAVAKARNESRPEIERLNAYTDLYTSLQKRHDTFEQAMNRNPDLTYQEGSDELNLARAQCTQYLADVRLEFETLVRELVSSPTEQEKDKTVPRLDLGALKKAIDVLDPDDREQMLAKVTTVEKKFEKAPDNGKKKGK
jgi:hypothetical protein